jgi:hypothetical protein
MFSNLTVGLLLGLGFGAWVYGKMQRQTGGDTKNSLVVAGLAALGAFLFMVMLLGFLF